MGDMFDRMRRWLKGGNENEDFWVADESCKVCYDCEEPFTLLVRRHHCRICGRVFCHRCTQHFLLSTSKTQTTASDFVRACNYCFNQRESNLTKHLRNSTQPVLRDKTRSCNAMLASLADEPGVLTADGQNPTALSVSPSSSNPSSSAACHAAPRRRVHPFSRRSLGSNLGQPGVSGPNQQFAHPRRRAASHFSRAFEADRNEEEGEAVGRGLSFGSGIKTRGAGDEAPRASHIRRTTSDPIERRVSMPNIYLPESVVFPESHPLDDYNFGYESSVNEQALASPQPSPKVPSEGPQAVWDGKVFLRGGPGAELDNNSRLWLPPPVLHDMPALRDPGRASNVDFHEQGGGCQAAPAGSGTDPASIHLEAREACHKAFQAVTDAQVCRTTAQLAQVPQMHVSQEWLLRIASLAIQAAGMLCPYKGRPGYPMDVRQYLKVKRVGEGAAGDSQVVRGVVCRKNVVHRRMASRHENPRVVLLLGALEYQRVSNRLSSLDTLLDQEREYLRVEVARITAHNPHVLLVEKTVARYAQELLLWHNVSVALNVKPEVMGRVARCTGAHMVSSTDRLAPASVGTCASFRIQSVLGKTLMFFQDCPHPLGCTVLLRGPDVEELRRVKQLLYLAVFSAYHHRLEAAFLGDHAASALMSTCTSASHPDARRALERVASEVVAAVAQVTELNLRVPSVTLSPHVCLHPPRELENEELGPTPPLNTTTNNNNNNNNNNNSNTTTTSPESGGVDRNRLLERLSLPLLMEQSLHVSVSSHCASRGEMCEPPKIHSIHTYRNSDVPLQHFLVAALPGPSKKCVDADCNEGPECHVRTYIHGRSRLTLRVRSLGHILDACGSSGEERRLSSEAIEKRDRGVWYWTHCLPCASEAAAKAGESAPTTVQTPRMLLSGPAASLSFGKFLELGFSAHKLTAPCGHRLMADRLRFYATQGGVACIGFDEIRPHRIQFPPPKVQYQDTMQARWMAVEVAELKHTVDNVLDVLTGMMNSVLESHRSKEQGSLAEDGRRGSEAGKLWLQHMMLNLETECREFSSQVNRVCATHGARLEVGEEGGVEGAESGRSRSQAGGAVPRNLPDIMEINSQRAKLEALFSMWVTKLQANYQQQSTAGAPTPDPAIASKSDNSSPATILFHSAEDLHCFFAGFAPIGPQFSEELYQDTQALHYPSYPYPASASVILSSNNGVKKTARSDKNTLGAAGSKPTLNPGPSASSHKGGTNTDVGSGLGPSSAPSRSNTTTGGDVPGNISKPLADNLQSSNSSTPASSSASSSGTTPTTELHAEATTTLTDSPIESNAGPASAHCELKDPEQAPVSDSTDLPQGSPCLSSRIASRTTPKAPPPSPNPAPYWAQSPQCIPKNKNISATSTTTSTVPESALSDGADISETASCSEDLVTRATSLGERSEPIVVNSVDASPSIESQDAGEKNTETVEDAKQGALRKLSLDENSILSQSKSMIVPSGFGELSAASSLEAPAPRVHPFTHNRSRSDTILGQTKRMLPPAPTADDSRASKPKPSRSSMVSATIREEDTRKSTRALPPPPPPAGRFAESVRPTLQPGADGLVVVVYDDEPTSVVAYTLCSREYQTFMQRALSSMEASSSTGTFAGGVIPPWMDMGLPPRSLSAASTSSPVNAGHQAGGVSEGDAMDRIKDSTNPSCDPPCRSASGSDNQHAGGYRWNWDALLSEGRNDMIHTFEDVHSNGGRTKFTTTVYFPLQFENLRKQCTGGNSDFVRSLCRCSKWAAKGGKSGAYFAKTLDDRYVVKQISRSEMTSFLEGGVGHAYLKYISNSLEKNNPTCLSKLLGLFQVHVKHIAGKGGGVKDVNREQRMEFVVQENLFYGYDINLKYDLKGSQRSRYAAATAGMDAVLLDENLLETMPSAPILVDEFANFRLQAALTNDSHFLSELGVMDYSLLVGISEADGQLVVGIIDYIRQYTWDKQLETYVKSSGVLGGGSKQPTIISPKLYKERFQRAMMQYLVTVPGPFTFPTSFSASANDDEASIPGDGV